MVRGFRVLAPFVLLLTAAPAYPQAPDSAATPPANASVAPAPPATGRPAFKALIIPAGAEKAVTLDGRLNEPEWANAESIPNLTQFEPEEGTAPSGRTVVKVLASPTGLVIGFHCDQDTSTIVASSKARDVELDEEDHVLFVIDTFGDQRSGFVFAVNALGSRFDGLINAQGDDVNSSWDALWEAGVTRDGTGWGGEIRIPLSSLNFKNGLDHWGLNVERRIQNVQESSRWSGAKRDFEIFQMTQAGEVTGLPAFDLGWGLTVRPSAVGHYFMPDPGEDREFESDLSLDATQKIGSNLTGTLTINTDFAETEVDARQTNLTRFDILFPEKRSFFLDGADIFEFGYGTNLEDAPVLPFNSRTIGIFTPEGEDEGTEVPLNVGGKIQGRIGHTNMGALMVGTGAVEDIGVPEAQMGVVRLSRNVLSESQFGLLFTSGDPIDRYSWTAGADFTYKTSKFMDDRNLQMGAWAAKVERDDLDEDRVAYGGKIAYPNDLWDLSASYFRVGEDFDPSLGFVQRTGDIYYASALVSPRPEKMNVRVLAAGATYFQVSQIDGGWESYLSRITPAELTFESGDELAVFVEPQGERPDEDFDVFDSPEKTVVLAAGSYVWTRYGVVGTFAAHRMLSGEVTYSHGGFYDGDLQTWEVDVRLKPHPVFSLQLTGERNAAQLSEDDFTQYLYGLRSEIKPSPELQFSNFLQYDNESRSLGSSSRLRWTFHPQGDMFVTFNQNLEKSFGGTDENFKFLTDDLRLKLQYTFRR